MTAEQRDQLAQLRKLGQAERALRAQYEAAIGATTREAQRLYEDASVTTSWRAMTQAAGLPGDTLRQRVLYNQVRAEERAQEAGPPGISQTDAARLLGAHREQVNRWLHGGVLTGVEHKARKRTSMRVVEDEKLKALIEQRLAKARGGVRSFEHGDAPAAH